MAMITGFIICILLILIIACLLYSPFKIRELISGFKDQKH